MADRVFKRKIYDKMLQWKQDQHGTTALLIRGARRIGKSTIAEQFAKQEYKSYIKIDFAKASKDIVQLFEDINNDGILEVNSLWSPENNLSNRAYQDFIHVWLQWDGESGLKAMSAILENQADGYRFMIPVAWMDALYYDFYTDGEIEWTEFYYENEERSFETIFSIAAVDQLIWQAMADNVTDSIVVLGNHPTLNKVYIANIKTNEFNEFQVNAEKLISCLQIEGGV